MKKGWGRKQSQTHTELPFEDQMDYFEDKGSRKARSHPKEEKSNRFRFGRRLTDSPQEKSDKWTRKETKEKGETGFLESARDSMSSHKPLKNKGKKTVFIESGRISMQSIKSGKSGKSFQSGYSLGMKKRRLRSMTRKPTREVEAMDAPFNLRNFGKRSFEGGEKESGTEERKFMGLGGISVTESEIKMSAEKLRSNEAGAGMFKRGTSDISKRKMSIATNFHDSSEFFRKTYKREKTGSSSLNFSDYIKNTRCLLMPNGWVKIIWSFWILL